MIELPTVLRRRPDVLYRHLPPETVLVRQGGPEIMVLNGIAGRILDLIDGERALAAIARTLEREYDAPSGVLEGDLLAFGGELLEAEVVSVVSMVPAVPGAGGAT